MDAPRDPYFGPEPGKPTEADDELRGLLSDRAREATTGAEIAASAQELNTRIARACNAALEQLQLVQPPDGIDFAPRDPQEVAGAAVVAAGGRLEGPGPLDGPRA